MAKGKLFKEYDRFSSSAGPCGLIWLDSKELKIQMEKGTSEKAKQGLKSFFHATHNKQPSVSEGKLADGVQGFMPEDLDKWFEELEKQRSENQVSNVVSANSNDDIPKDEQRTATGLTPVPKPLEISNAQLKMLEEVGEFLSKQNRYLFSNVQTNAERVSKVTDLTIDLQRVLQEIHDDGSIKDTDVSQLMLRLKLDMLNEFVPNRLQDVAIGRIRKKFSQDKRVLKPGVVADQLFTFAEQCPDTGDYDLSETSKKTTIEKISKDWPQAGADIDFFRTFSKLQDKMIGALSDPHLAMGYIKATRFKKDPKQTGVDEKKVEEMLTSWNEEFNSISKISENFVSDAENYYIQKEGRTIREDNEGCLTRYMTIDGIRHRGLESSPKRLSGLSGDKRKQVSQYTLDLIADRNEQANGSIIRTLEKMSEDYSIGQDCRNIITTVQQELK